MPLLFLLPSIILGAFLESIWTANKDIFQALANGAKSTQQFDAETQIEVLTKTVALLRDQLCEMHKQQDRWQSSAEQVSLTANY
jgi:hypothetical protein